MDKTLFFVNKDTPHPTLPPVPSKPSQPPLPHQLSPSEQLSIPPPPTAPPPAATTTLRYHPPYLPFSPAL